MFINSWRILKNGFKSIWRNLWVSLSTLSIIVLALLVVGSLILFNASVDSVAQYFRDKADVSVYFDTNTPEEYILEMQEQIREREEVKQVSYTSFEEAEIRFRRENPDTIEGLDQFDEHILPASLEIKVYNLDQFATVVEFIRVIDTEQYISEKQGISYADNEAIITRLNGIARNLNIGGIIFSVLFGIFVFFVTYNTIRLAIYSASEEIHIMKLVGASNWFVRGPFLVAGTFYGVFSSLIVMGILIGITYWFGEDIGLDFGSIDLYEYTLNNVWVIYGILLGAGIILGGISSYVAVKRYLKV